MIKEFLNRPRSEYEARPLWIPGKDDIIVNGRRVTYFDLGPSSPKPNLDRDLDGDPYYKYYGIFPYVMFSDLRYNIPAITIFGVMFRNMTAKKPMLRGSIPLISALAVGGYCLGGYINARRFRSQQQTDLIIWDYVNKHPELFPELFEKRKTYGEVLMPWRPVR